MKALLTTVVFLMLLFACRDNPLSVRPVEANGDERITLSADEPSKLIELRVDLLHPPTVLVYEFQPDYWAPSSRYRIKADGIELLNNYGENLTFIVRIIQ